MRFETKCTHTGYIPENGEPLTPPIVQSTTFKYDSTEYIGQLFDLTAGGYFYTRLANPTVGYVEEKLTALEGGVGAMMTSSGQAANLIAIMNIAGVGDSFLCASNIYGGTVNLFAVTFERMGIEAIFYDIDAPSEEIAALIKPNTKAMFAETLANPSMAVCDIERLSAIAHEAGIPFIIDNTFPTPYLCRPIEFGADIVTHSTTKYLDGHAVQVGGMIVDSGNFDWTASDKFPGLTQPDESYHGVVYTEQFGKAAYITKCRTHLMRDLGSSPTAHAAFLLNLGIETLPLRMERHSSNALAVAKLLAASDKVERVGYPGLEGDKYHALAEKYLPLGSSGVICFDVKGGREAAVRFMDSLKLLSLVVHVADVRSLALHPASATHRQLTDEQLIASGIGPGTIRLSIGIENVDDILEDIQQALDKV